jgi:hypothetical protein
MNWVKYHGLLGKRLLKTHNLKDEKNINLILYRCNLL